MASMNQRFARTNVQPQQHRSNILYSSSRSSTSSLAARPAEQLKNAIDSHMVNDSEPAPESGSKNATIIEQKKKVMYSSPIGQGGYVPSGGSSASRVQKIVTEVEEYNQLFGEDTAQFILDTRERERRELHELNDRLAAYLERMRMLELQNRDLENLKQRWLSDVANVKSAYERELNVSQKDYEDASRNRGVLEAQIRKIQAEYDDLRSKFEQVVRERDDNKAKVENLLRQLQDAENELNKFSRRVQVLEDEVARLKNENGRLQADLQKTKADLDRETMKVIDYENQIQALLKKMESMRREFDQEVTELRNRESTIINAEQYKSDLANAIRDIRKEFDSLALKNKQDLESWYVKKVQEVHVSQNDRYKDEAGRLGMELESVRTKILDLEALNGRLNREIKELENQLQREKYEYESALSISETHIKKMLVENRNLQEKLKALYDTNQNLYAEIAIYRKLLDTEEFQVGAKGIAAAKGVDSSYYSGGSPSSVRRQFGGSPGGRIIPTSGSYVSKQEDTSQSNFQRASKGNVQIADVSPEGKFIKLENLSMNKDEPMGEWKLVRLIDNKRELVFTFPVKFTLKAGRMVTVWARNQGGVNNYVDSFVYEGDSTWGVGTNAVTILYNKEGEERGSFTQVLSTSQVSTI
uniref:Intermediate filament protein n=1 Tax=Romanomermis culicivorax TaxID=13658 RepID=A0A915KSP0_ROMCU